MNIRVRSLATWLNALSIQITPALILLSKEIESFNIIHMHNFRTFQNIVVAYHARRHRIPYVLQAHGSLPRMMPMKRLKRMYDKLWGCRLLRDAAKVVALNPTEVDQHVSMGMSEGRIEIVPNGIDLSEFENLPERGEFRREYGLDSNQKMILYLARIHKIKSPDLLAEAFAKLPQDAGHVTLVIVGPDDGYLASLKRSTAELGIAGRVLFTGPLYGEDKLRAYVDADVYVLPSSYETFPNTVLEALACGTSVVITDRCGIADVINGEAGLVVSHDKDELSSAISRMLGDDDLREAFGERGKRLVREKFNWERIAEQMERVYSSLLHSEP